MGATKVVSKNRGVQLHPLTPSNGGPVSDFRFWVQVCKAELLCRRGWFKKTIHAWNDKSFVISRRSFAFWFDLCLPRMFAQWMITTTLLRFIKYARVVELSFSFPNWQEHSTATMMLLQNSINWLVWRGASQKIIAAGNKVDQRQM